MTEVNFTWILGGLCYVGYGISHMDNAMSATKVKLQEGLPWVICCNIFSLEGFLGYFIEDGD